MFKTFALVSILFTLAACGGGGASTPALPDSTQAIKDALDKVADKIPASKPFTGAFMAVNGTSIGYVSGKDKYDAVAFIASRIMDAPTGANAEAYRLMLSDAGLRVVLFGESVGTSSINGVPLYAPDSHAVVTLRVDGMHIVFVAN